MDLHVIIPSIGNPCGLIATLQVLISLQSDKQEILYSVVADEGDVDTINATEMVARKKITEDTSEIDCAIKTIEQNLNQFINQVANEEDAEVTMVLCDDVLPLTANWDYVASLINCPLFGWKELNNPMSFTYPVISRTWREVTGYVLCDRFPYWFADSWSAEVFNMAMGVPVPIVDGLKLGGRRGKTRGMRDLPFWLEYWIRTRKVRIAEAEKIAGGPIEKSFIEGFKIIDEIHLRNLEVYHTMHAPADVVISKPNSPMGVEVHPVKNPSGSPSHRYVAAKIEAEKWLAENPA